jgi:arylsulfatase A-like enzyme
VTAVTEGTTRRPPALGAHLSAGAVVGTVSGAVYFVLEPLLGFWGRYDFLGAPLSRILGVYLLFGFAVGAVVGLVGGAASALRGREWNANRSVPVYAAVIGALIVLMYVTRNRPMSRFQAVPSLADVAVFLSIAGGFLAAGTLGARAFERRPVFGRANRRAGWMAVAGCVAAIAAAHIVAGVRENRWAPAASGKAPAGPNVVLVLLDALRADHVSAYGYRRETTPVIDGLAREGVLFRNAHSHGNRTIIAVPSIFTSLYPSFHGAIGRGEIVKPLAEERTTIAEIFRDEGYATVGLMTNEYLKRGFGLEQGFDRIDPFYAERYLLGLYKLLRHLHVVERPGYAVALHANAAEVTDRALHRLRRLDQRPFLLYAHFMDTHHPYAPPPPYDSMFGRVEGAPGPAELFAKTRRALSPSGGETLSRGEVEQLENYYDGSIRFADDQIGRLLREAARVSGERELVVVITSDHGDEFFEHGLFYHNNLLYEDLIHVPLVFWSSKRFARGLEVRGLARHVDILPTLSALIGAGPPPGVAGRSLLPVLEGEPDTADVESFAEGDFCASLSHGGWKMMMVDSTGAFHLYDVSRDPDEREDLSAAAPDVYERMKAKLSEYVQAAAAERRRSGAAQAKADEETVRKLKALGYM